MSRPQRSTSESLGADRSPVSRIATHNRGQDAAVRHATAVLNPWRRGHTYVISSLCVQPPYLLAGHTTDMDMFNTDRPDSPTERVSSPAADAAALRNTNLKRMYVISPALCVCVA